MGETTHAVGVVKSALAQVDSVRGDYVKDLHAAQTAMSGAGCVPESLGNLDAQPGDGAADGVGKYDKASPAMSSPSRSGWSELRKRRRGSTEDQRTCARPRCSTASRLAAMSSPEVRNARAAVASSHRPSAVCESSMR